MQANDDDAHDFGTHDDDDAHNFGTHDNDNAHNFGTHNDDAHDVKAFVDASTSFGSHDVDAIGS